MDLAYTESAAEQAQQLIQFIQDRIIRRPGVHIDENTPLISSGVIDSFALIEIFLTLETVTHRKIPGTKVRAKDMDTVGMMIAVAERIGKPEA